MTVAVDAAIRRRSAIWRCACHTLTIFHIDFFKFIFFLPDLRLEALALPQLFSFSAARYSTRRTKYSRLCSLISISVIGGDASRRYYFAVGHRAAESALAEFRDNIEGDFAATPSHECRPRKYRQK